LIFSSNEESLFLQGFSFSQIWQTNFMISYFVLFVV